MTRTRTGVALLLLVLVISTIALHATNSGPIVQTVMLDEYPGSIAVDTQTKRAFLLTLNAGFGAGYIRVLDTATGALLRTISVGKVRSGGVGNVAVDRQSGHVFVAVDGAGNVAPPRELMLDAREGTVLNTVALGSDPAVAVESDPASMAIDERAGRVLVTSMGVVWINGGTSAVLGSEVSVLNARTGGLWHATGVEGLASTVAVDSLTRHAIVINRRSMILLDTRTGRPLYTAALSPTSRPMIMPAAVDERTHRAFMSEPTDIAVFDTETGKHQRTVAVPGGPSAIAVASEAGRVFVSVDTGTATGSVLVLDAASGRLLQTLPLTGNPGQVAIDDRRGHVFVANEGAWDSRSGYTGPGSISVLDVRTGALLRTIPVVGIPSAVAVDERTGYLFVGSRFPPTTHVQAPDTWGWIPPWLGRWLPFLPRRASTHTMVASVSAIDTTRYLPRAARPRH